LPGRERVRGRVGERFEQAVREQERELTVDAVRELQVHGGAVALAGGGGVREAVVDLDDQLVGRLERDAHAGRVFPIPWPGAQATGRPDSATPLWRSFSLRRYIWTAILKTPFEMVVVPEGVRLMTASNVPIREGPPTFPTCDTTTLQLWSVMSKPVPVA
jgi:hypothetical protein